MSHQVMVKTAIKDKEALQATLTDLGYTFVENGDLIGYNNTNEGKVDLLVKVGDYSSRVGFKYNSQEDVYDLVGDFYSTGISKESFRNSIKKNYAAKKVEVLLRKKRYNVVKKSETNKGAIRIMARSAA